MPQPFPQLRPPVSSLSPFPFLPSHRRVPRPFPSPTRPFLSGLTLPGGATRRFAVTRGSPHPRPRCSLLCPAPATLPSFPRCSRLEMVRVAPSPVSALFLRAAFHSSIHLFMFSGVDSVSPHAQILLETPGTVLGFRDRKMKR